MPQATKKRQSEISNASFGEQITSSYEPMKTYTTLHFCRLPVMYAVDAYGAPVGQDDSTISLNGDGTLESAKQKRDQRIPELITAIGDAVPKIAGGHTESGSAANPYEFYPPLPPGAVILEINGLTEMR
eukprot:TRINITY_DN2225_c0_g2_i5.p1 TRINITY_DN2225_c0_g2~~TRINITY_DN2225_c0_g2_i5.p1  ORF type:complete len:129 (+),score=3.56 TRINITY_DN2225_c0_g2_i5:199-585(+)